MKWYARSARSNLKHESPYSKRDRDVCAGMATRYECCRDYILLFISGPGPPGRHPCFHLNRRAIPLGFRRVPRDLPFRRHVAGLGAGAHRRRGIAEICTHVGGTVWWYASTPPLLLYAAVPW